MKILNLGCAVLLALVPAALMGCGGGGGGGNGGPRTPTPTVTATATTTTVPTVTSSPVPGDVVIVQLREGAATGAPVDGVVSVSGVRQATVNGNASLIGVPRGNVTISVDVNGQITTQAATIGAGTTTVTVVISSVVTPTASSTVPPPPF